MAIRGYVQPKTILGSIQYLNPNYENISVDKQLIPIDSAIQALNPDLNTLKVVLPEVIYCDGMIFDIINTSDQSSGLLEIWEYTNTTKICDISPNEKRQIICLNNEWRIYDIRTTVTIANNTTTNYSFIPTMTSNEINNIISNIPKYIPSTLNINLNFADNVFIDTNLIIENFYGNGTINIKCSSSGCHTSMIASSGNIITVLNNNDVKIVLTDLIIQTNGTITPSFNYGIHYEGNENVKLKILRNKISSSHSNSPTDFPIYCVNNQSSVLSIDDSRIVCDDSVIGNYGIYCTYKSSNPITKTIVNAKNVAFGNLDTGIFSQGDYSISMLQCSKAMTEDVIPLEMPNMKGYDIMYGGKLAIDTMSDTNLPNGNVAADSTKIIIPAL